MSSKITETEKNVSHPMEEIFEIEECTTIVPYKEVKTDLVPYEPFDNKDKELEEQFQNLHDRAIEAFENQQEDIEVIDPKYKARNAEVAIQYLRTALEAVQSKSLLKQHKDKINVKQKTGTVNNNVVLANRNDIIRAIQGKTVEPEKDDRIIDVDPEEE